MQGRGIQARHKGNAWRGAGRRHRTGAGQCRAAEINRQPGMPGNRKRSEERPYGLPSSPG